MKVAVRVENVTKCFSPKNLSAKSYVLNKIVRKFFNYEKNNIDANHLRNSEFILRSINFNILQGESVAIIGSNGVGKSTLLKIIAGIIHPNDGMVKTFGNIQSLINLGTGFDARLSGLENIKRTGALSGYSNMTTELVERIKNFADLGNKIYSPVETYSSGMHARLGFSIAVHLAPDIILIDEILSVGDESFKIKCLSKMQELKSMGVTMLLVSHSSAAIRQFCSRAIWLEDGLVKMDGKSDVVLEEYIASQQHGQIVNAENSTSSRLPENIYGHVFSDEKKITGLKLLINGLSQCSIETNNSIKIEYEFWLVEPVRDLNVSLNIYRLDGLLITTISTLNGDLVKTFHDGKVSGVITIKDLNLSPGEYVIVMPIHDGLEYLFRDEVGTFKIISRKNLCWGISSFKYDYEVNNS